MDIVMGTPDEPKPLTIGQVAKLAGIGVETVRFYERKGIVEAPPRTAAGYRQYSEAVVARLRFTRRAKELGFTLREIKELLSLRFNPDVTRADVKALAEAKVTALEGRIRGLREMKKELAQMIEACTGRGSTDTCPILEGLERGGKP